MTRGPVLIEKDLVLEGPKAQNRGQTGSRYIVVMNVPTSGYDGL